MIDIRTVSLSLEDILLLIGTAQSLYIMVYLLFRSGRISRGTIPLVYFANMSAAFMLTFIANNLSNDFSPILKAQSLLWAFQPPLCVLLIIQVAQIYKVPSWKHYWVLLLVPVAYGAANFAAKHYGITCIGEEECQTTNNWFQLTSLIAGAASLLSLIVNWKIISNLTKQKNHQERYWLVLALLFINIVFIATLLFNTDLNIKTPDIDLITIIFGLVLVYLSGKSLFRIYPQAVLITTESSAPGSLTPAEQSLAEKIEELIYVQKIYHEPAYSRANLARECDVPEAIISKIINKHFQQSLPSLLNTQRVEDAKRLIIQTDEDMSVIAKEAGFNSLATFNRVFKAITGHSPSYFKATN